jgi:aspartate kinase
MQIKVMKFGGTSVATEESRAQIYYKVNQRVSEGFKVVLVVSAMGRLGQPYATDTLISLLPDQTCESSIARDLILSCGETISAALISAGLSSLGILSIPLMGFQAGIYTDSNFGDANVTHVDQQAVLKQFEKFDVVVVTGFQGLSAEGLITTLGRGGSDYTASVLGVYLDAESIEIYTDVDGVMTADPRVVKDARVLKTMSHSEIYQLAIDGAKVVDHKAIALAMQAKKPLLIKNTFSNEEGTIIRDIVYDTTGEFIERGPVFTAVTSKNDICLISAKLSPHQRDLTQKMLQTFEQYGIVLDLVNFYTHQKIFVVSDKSKDTVLEILNNLRIEFSVVDNLSKITGVGSYVRYVPEIMKSVMRLLMLANIEVLQTMKTESTVACLIKFEDVNKVVNILHKHFTSVN